MPKFMVEKRIFCIQCIFKSNIIVHIIYGFGIGYRIEGGMKVC